MPDETRRLGPDPDGGSGEPDDPTVAGAPPDETRQFPAPAADDTRPGLDDTVSDGVTDAPPTWSGRAAVPPVGTRPATPPPAWDQPPPDEGRWWMPIVIGLVALLLLGALGYGLWLIAAADEEEPSPGGTATATAPPTTSAAPTTRPPTTEPPRTTEAERIEVPRLAGVPLADAQAQLDGLGLVYRVRFEETDEQEPGTVLRTRPDEGSLVAPGTRITLVVAAAPPATEGPTATSTPG